MKGKFCWGVVKRPQRNGYSDILDTHHHISPFVAKSMNIRLCNTNVRGKGMNGELKKYMIKNLPKSIVKNGKWNRGCYITIRKEDWGNHEKVYEEILFQLTCKFTGNEV